MKEKDIATNQLNIGENIRQLRQQKKISLNGLSERAQVSKSNLSKIENNVVSPTFDMLERIAKGLGVETVSLLSRAGSDQPCLAFTSRGEGKCSSSENYEFEFMFSDLPTRKMVPFFTTVKPHQSEVFSKPSSHSGEEFFTVLEGTVEFRSEGGEGKVLCPGDSVYFSSRLAHLVLNVGEENARLLWVWVS